MKFVKTDSSVRLVLSYSEWVSLGETSNFLHRYKEELREQEKKFNSMVKEDIDDVQKIIDNLKI